MPEMPFRFTSVLLSLLLCSCADKGTDQVPEQAMGATYRALEVQDFQGASEAQWDELLVDKFTLSRGGCYGPCAIYQVEFFRGGRARYTGADFAPRVGVFQGEMSLYGYALLCSLSERIKLNEMSNQYSASWTDDETVTITVDSDGVSKTIEDYGQQAPPEFQAFRALFDELAEEVTWEQIPKER